MIYRLLPISRDICISLTIEGFGIPIIEALNSGVPVVAATGSCLEEAGGPDSIYVDPDDSKELANAFKHIYSNSEKRKEMIEKGVVLCQTIL